MAQRRANNILQALGGVRQNRVDHLAEMLHPNLLQQLLMHLHQASNPFGQEVANFVGGSHHQGLPVTVSPHGFPGHGDPSGPPTVFPIGGRPGEPGDPRVPHPPTPVMNPLGAIHQLPNQPVHLPAQFLNPPPPVSPMSGRPADLLHALGANAAAAAMWQQHHSGNANAPNWVVQQWNAQRGPQVGNAVNPVGGYS